MNASDGNDKWLAIVGLITVVVYLGAFGLAPARAPNSASPGVQIVHYATVHRDQLLASELLFALGVALLMVFAAGLYRTIRRAEGERGWFAIASLANVIAGAGIFGAGTALFMTVAYRPATDPAVARALWDAGWLAYNSAGFAFGAWIAIVVAVPPPGAPAMDGMDRGLDSAHQPRRAARREGWNRAVLTARVVRHPRWRHLRRVAPRPLRSGVATGARSSRDLLTSAQARSSASGARLRVG
jgi:hypothetical protein